MSGAGRSIFDEPRHLLRQRSVELESSQAEEFLTMRECAQLKPSVANTGEIISVGDNHARDLARRRLGASPYPELRRISCEHRRGAIILEGRVRSYYMKQVAQTLIGNVPGVGTIVNCLEVEY